MNSFISFFLFYKIPEKASPAGVLFCFISHLDKIEQMFYNKYYLHTVFEVNDKEGGAPIRFDFEKWINKAVESDIEKKEIEVDGLIVRLEAIEGERKSSMEITLYKITRYEYSFDS